MCHNSGAIRGRQVMHFKLCSIQFLLILSDSYKNPQRFPSTPQRERFSSTSAPAKPPGNDFRNWLLILIQRPIKPDTMNKPWSRAKPFYFSLIHEKQ